MHDVNLNVNVNVSVNVDCSCDAARRRLAHDTQSEPESEQSRRQSCVWFVEMVMVREGEEGRAGECVESGKGKGTAIRATGTIKRASKRNVYLPSLRAPFLSPSLYPLSLSSSLPSRSPSFRSIC